MIHHLHLTRQVITRKANTAAVISLGTNQQTVAIQQMFRILENKQILLLQNTINWKLLAQQLKTTKVDNRYMLPWNKIWSFINMKLGMQLQLKISNTNSMFPFSRPITWTEQWHQQPINLGPGSYKRIKRIPCNKASPNRTITKAGWKQYLHKLVLLPRLQQNRSTK